MSQTRTLLEISEDLLELEEELDLTGGDVTDNEQLLDNYLDAVGDRDEKLDNYAALIVDVEARAETRKAEAQRMAELARLDKEKAKFLKERLRQFFLAHKLKTVHTKRYRLTHANNGGVMPIRYLCAAEDLPEDLRTTKVTYQPNSDEIRKRLEAKEDLRDFAEFGERGSSIRIK